MNRIALPILLLILLSCQKPVNHVTRPLMGTSVNLTMVCDTELAGAAAGAAFGEIERIEKLLSPVRPESDLYRLNHGGSAGPVTVTGETRDLIKRSVDLSAETGGCFDITFAALEGLWNYKDKNFTPPSPGAVAILLPLVGSKNIILNPDGKSISFARPGVKIGLGAIAKGYAVMKGVEALKGKGVKAGIVDAGGDLQVFGKKFFGSWVTGLRHPRKDAILLTIDLEDMDAIATSGDYERFVMRNGVRYHHIIDPRSGYPTKTFTSVSVISKSAALSDAYATAIFVMGLEKAREFLKQHGEIDVILADDKVNLYISKRLKERITVLEKHAIEWL
ncbi:MAG: FAD:protein FMN transferase [Spirochaetes bacterium]|nr:FAD:protein FMN transferase [Spirochaetota bacterium]